MMLSIKIPEKEHGTRLDRCVRRLLGQLNQSLLEKFLRSGMILLDGKKAKSSPKVSIGQELNYSQKISFEEPSIIMSFPNTVISPPLFLGVLIVVSLIATFPSNASI